MPDASAPLTMNADPFTITPRPSHMRHLAVALVFLVACTGGQHYTGFDGGDDGPPPIDGLPAPDADTSVAIVETYQSADLELGQIDFTHADDNLYAANSTISQGVAVDNGILWISDTYRRRVFAWSPLPTNNNTSATHVLGRFSLTDDSTPTGVTGGNLGLYTSVAADGGKVVVSDPQRNRVLVWTSTITTDGVSANRILGQATSTASAASNAATGMSGPTGVWTDGTKVVVADSFNHRVLIWNSFPNANGDSADLVIGQAGFGTGSAPTTVTGSRLKSPVDVWSDGTRLAVADSGNNRVLIWSSWPTQNGQAADLVLGQPDLQSGGAGLSADQLSSPSSVSGNADALFVADAVNDRVVVYSPFPTASDTPATYVLGQPDLGTGGNNPSPTDKSLDGPTDVEVAGNYLWVADQVHARALRFALYPQ